MAREEAAKPRPFRGCIPDEALKHARAAHEEMRKGVHALFPPEFVEHRHRARKEMLLAIRSMVDAALERIEGDEK